MGTIRPSGHSLGGRIEGIDPRQRCPRRTTRWVVRSRGWDGVLCFPRQSIDAVQQKGLRAPASARSKSTWQPANSRCRDIPRSWSCPTSWRMAGLSDWRTPGRIGTPTCPTRKPIALLNVLYAVRVPVRHGSPLGATEFLNMRRAYDDLPADLRAAHRGAHGNPRLQQVLGANAEAAGHPAQPVDARAAAPEAASVAPDRARAPDLGGPRPQCRVCHRRRWNDKRRER